MFALRIFFCCILLTSCARVTGPSLDEHLGVLNANLFMGRAVLNSGAYLIMGSDGSVLRSTNGQSWSASDTSAITDSIYDFNEHPSSGLLIGVGDAGLIIRSDNGGLSWSNLESGVDVALRRVVFSEFSGCWLAVGDNGRALKSCNSGRDWQKITAPGVGNYTSVVSLENSREWVVGGERGLWLSSDEGLSWREVVEGQSYSVARLVYLDEQDLLFALTANSVILRRHGSAWKASKVDTDKVVLNQMAVSPERLLVSGSSGSVYSSADWGLTWQAQFVDERYFSQVAWLSASRKFVLAGNNGAVFVADQRLQKWQAIDLGASSDVESILPLSDGRTSLLIGQGGHVSSLSAGGSVKQLRKDLNGFVQDLVLLPSGRLVAAGSAGLLWYSGDYAQTWKDANSEVNEQYYLLSLGYLPNSNVLLAAGPPGVILRSTDEGVNWQTVYRNDSGKYNYIHKILVDSVREWALAVAGPGQLLFSNDAGMTWLKGDADTQYHLFNAAQNPISGTFIAVGQNGSVQRSRNGLTWFQMFIGQGQDLQSITYHAASERWFVVGKKGALYESNDDGISWMQKDTETTENLYHIAVIGDRQLIATGVNGTLLTSQNAGDTWQVTKFAEMGNLREPKVLANGTILVPSKEGQVLISRDSGQRWTKLKPHTSQSLKVVEYSDGQNLVIAAGARIIRMKPEAQ